MSVRQHFLAFGLDGGFIDFDMPCDFLSPGVHTLANEYKGAKHNAYDCDASHLVIIPVWSQNGWPKLICSFDDLTSLKFSQFDFATLGGGSNGAKA